MNGLKSRFVARVEGPRMKGWIELTAGSRITAKVECAGAFKGLVVTLYERADDGFGYIKLGVIVAPASQSVVEVVAS